MRAGGGWQIFQKLTSGGDDYSLLESMPFIYTGLVKKFFYAYGRLRNK